MAQVDSERKMRRLVPLVGVVALALVLVAFVTVAMKTRRVAFTSAAWASGKGNFTTDNPRIRMQEEVIARIREGRLSKQQVIKLLGPSEEKFSVKTTGGAINTAYSMHRPAWHYVLGVRPKTPTQPQRIVVLTMNFDRTGRAETIFTDEVAYPTGSSIEAFSPITPAAPSVFSSGVASAP